MPMTRKEAKQLEYDNPFPKERNGKCKAYEEVYINNGGEKSPGLAAHHLVCIQEGHDEDHGWYTEPGHEGVFKDDDGLWYAFRHHAQYR